LAITDDIFVLLPEFADLVIILIVVILVFVVSTLLDFQENVKAVIALNCAILMSLGVMAIISSYYIYICIFIVIVMLYVEFKPSGGNSEYAVD
jgi:hypothetical protein